MFKSVFFCLLINDLLSVQWSFMFGFSQLYRFWDTYDYYSKVGNLLSQPCFVFVLTSNVWHLCAAFKMEKKMLRLYGNLIFINLFNQKNNYWGLSVTFREIGFLQVFQFSQPKNLDYCWIWVQIDVNHHYLYLYRH